MDPNAIHEDANENVDEKPISVRDQMLEQMGERREKELLAPPEEEPKKEEAEPAKKETADGGLVKVVIDGEEQELPLSAVVRGFQKEAAASKRLEEAAQRRKELDEQEAQLQARKAELDTLEEQLKKQTAAPPDEEDDIAPAFEAMVENADTAKMAEAIRKTVEKALRKATPSASEDEIAKAVEKKLAEREAKTQEDAKKKAQAEIDDEYQKANAQFVKDYADIVSDPDLLAVANRRYYSKLDAGKSITDAMAEAGKETKEWMTSRKSPREEKLQRKSQIDNLPVVGARSVSRQDEDNAPQSASTIIAEMRKARGLAV